MLKFEFVTDAGAWYVDNVSFKEKYNSSVELIVDGGFESGAFGTNWQYCHTVHSWFSGHLTNTTVFAGRYSFVTADFGSKSHDFLTQSIPVKQNTVYVIEFYLVSVGIVDFVKVTVESR